MNLVHPCSVRVTQRALRPPDRRSSSVELEVQMAPHEPATDRLVEAARNAPDGLIARLVESDDFRESLLGQAIRDFQRASTSSQEAADEVLPINPVTHDPAW
ncbi:hypothetical protein [Streptomyces sp. NPDC002463]|uniref:hypothetical protein n=1 Tax=Streptomyces sp. NPDC002463 TaxID=3364645 RepID=UPI0036CE3390